MVFPDTVLVEDEVDEREVAQAEAGHLCLHGRVARVEEPGEGGDRDRGHERRA